MQRDDKRDALRLFHMGYHNSPFIPATSPAFNARVLLALQSTQISEMGIYEARRMNSCCRAVCHSVPLEMVFVNPFPTCMEVSQYTRLNVLFSSCSSTLWRFTLCTLPRWRSSCIVSRSNDCDCSLIVLFKSNRDCHVGDVLGHLMEDKTFSEQRTRRCDQFSFCD